MKEKKYTLSPGGAFIVGLAVLIFFASAFIMRLISFNRCDSVTAQVAAVQETMRTPSGGDSMTYSFLVKFRYDYKGKTYENVIQTKDGKDYRKGSYATILVERKDPDKIYIPQSAEFLFAATVLALIWNIFFFQMEISPGNRKEEKEEKETEETMST